MLDDWRVGPGYHLTPLAFKMIAIAVIVAVTTIVVIWSLAAAPLTPG